MSRYFRLLNKVQYLVLLLIITFLRAWIEIDQLFLGTDLSRRIVFYLLIFITFTAFFFFVKPEQPIRLSVYLSFLLLLVTVLLSVVQHVLISHNFALYYERSIMLWCVVFVFPYLVGLIYQLLKKKSQGNKRTHIIPIGKR